MKIEVANRMALGQAIKAIEAQFHATGYCDITLLGERRKLEQNALFWVWCRQVAKQEDQGRTERDVAADAKLEWGFEIRRRDDTEFDDLLTKTIDKVLFAGRREMAHALAKEIECTSRMDKKQMYELLERMQAHYAQHAGIILEWKDKPKRKVK